MSEKLLKEIHAAYLNCKEVFEPSFELGRQLTEIEDKDERAFYELLYNFFLQQRQREVIENESY